MFMYCTCLQFAIFSFSHLVVFFGFCYILSMCVKGDCWTKGQYYIDCLLCVADERIDCPLQYNSSPHKELSKLFVRDIVPAKPSQVEALQPSVDTHEAISTCMQQTTDELERIHMDCTCGLHQKYTPSLEAWRWNYQDIQCKLAIHRHVTQHYWVYLASLLEHYTRFQDQCRHFLEWQTLHLPLIYPVHTGHLKPVSNRFLKCNCIHTLFVNQLRLKMTNTNMHTSTITDLEADFSTHMLADSGDNGVYKSVLLMTSSLDHNAPFPHDSKLPPHGDSILLYMCM